jgi:hypothetical protein
MYLAICFKPLVNVAKAASAKGLKPKAKPYI